MARQLTLAGIGQRIVAHVGGDMVIGRNPHEYLQALADDDATAAVLFCGEIGGDKEYAFAQAARGFPKPVYAMVVGRHAPAEKQMGHAGALIGSAREGADAKLKALAAAGCRIVKGPEAGGGDAVGAQGAARARKAIALYTKPKKRAGLSTRTRSRAVRSGR